MKNPLQTESFAAKLKYLYQTPSALIHLLIKNVVSAKDVFRHFDRIDNRFYLLGFPLNPNLRQKEVMDYLQLLKIYFLGSRPHDKALLKLIEQCRVRESIHSLLVV